MARQDHNVVDIGDAVLLKLPCIDVVVVMLRTGSTPEKVAEYIQADCRLLESMPRYELVSRLITMQDKLADAVGPPLSDIDPNDDSRVDELSLLADLYEMQYKRLLWIEAIERKADYPIKTFPLEIGAARAILKVSGELRDRRRASGALTTVPDDGKEKQLRLLESKYGKSVMSVLASPARRRKLLGTVEMLRADDRITKTDELVEETLRDQEDDDGNDG
jgi:hypothetical protein